CTSNIGSDILLAAGETHFEQAKEQVLGMMPQYFRPELINRFDRTIVFKPLTKDNLRKICFLNLEELGKKLEMQGIMAYYSDITVDFLVERSYNPGLGARPLKRAIQDYIENTIARYILQVQTQTGGNPKEVNFDEIVSQIQS